MVTREGPRPASAEQQLKKLGIELPAPPEPFGTYTEAVQTGSLLFLSGMLPTEGHGAKFIGRVAAELDVEAERRAAHLAAFNVLAVQHLGSLDKVTRINIRENESNRVYAARVEWGKRRILFPSTNQGSTRARESKNWGRAMFRAPPPSRCFQHQI